MEDTAIEWPDYGAGMSSQGDLSEYVTLLRAEVLKMRTGLARAAWGAFTGKAWDETGKDDEKRPTADDVVRNLDQTVPPAGRTAKDAVLRQSVATLLAALDAAERASSSVWLAHVNAQDPNRTA
jgi:hypothetical protein